MKTKIAAILVALVSILSTLLAARHEDPVRRASDDGRVAAVTDLQGTALVRPVGRERWTPLAPRSVLLPGDQVRTSPRGAHAVELQLAGGGSLVLGPGALLELIDARMLHLLRGDLEVTPAAGVALTCTGPGGFRRTLDGAAVLRADDRDTRALDEAPRWLTGYRSSTTSEWMGSLLARVDGREVPLSVGYHHVDVVIKDQIAQTTVEQSFVNATKSRLEGVFYFPLPADASISGFGMWIGDELVEADIVEKQKARAIYEDILRRKKDPGLLEWSGGNLFKASVFPIEGQSEKRIRIRYTQVLPLEGATLRYRYALRSELLRQHPLRELSIKVSAVSSTPIAAVASATHEVRARHDAATATVEFDASEYTPESDFETTLTLAALPPLTAVAHRRGGDGYFMLRLTPPGEPAAWQRELLPEAAPLDLLLVADTSGSMDEAARAAQTDFVAGLLELLGPKDRFRLLAADVGVHWLREEPLAGGEEATRAALAFLAQRSSLGWTDLDRALAAAASAAAPGTTVIYVGDGIGTTGDADPVALAERLARLDARGAAMHAVSTGATYEQAVLEAIARLGHGTVRAAGDAPATAAYRLLAELAQPALTDLAVEVRGVRTARVYPEELPHVAAGTQQIVLGRFLPEGGAGRAEVVVTGKRGGEPVRWVAECVIPADEAGNSFLPRLWARRHLDALLAKGSSRAVQDEIVAFSERFDIITPFTSFLVLESDEDRAHYGVTRRVQMRDGEMFFATARDTAATEALRAQMKAARAWRLDLRAHFLREIERLGRELPQPVAVGGMTRGAGNKFGALRQLGQDPDVASAKELPAEQRAIDEEQEVDGRDDDEDLRAPFEPLDEPGRAVESSTAAATPAPSLREEKAAKRKDFAGLALDYAGRAGRMQVEGYFDQGIVGRSHYEPISFASCGFPDLPAAPRPEQAQPAPAWPEEIIELLRALDRRPLLRMRGDGLSVRATTGGVHALRGTWGNREVAEVWWSPSAWWMRVLPRGGQTLEQWLARPAASSPEARGTRGVAAIGLRLGRTRPAEATDAGEVPFWLPDSSLHDLVQLYRTYTPRVVKREAGVVVLAMRAPGETGQEIELTIDAERRVLLGSRVLADGVLQSATELGGFTRVAGMWWATTARSLDAKGRTVWRAEIEVRELGAGELERALQERAAGVADVLFAESSDPPLAAAVQGVHAGKADFLQRLRVALHHAEAQQWDAMWTAFDGGADLVQDQPALPWLRASLLSWSRRGEELQHQLGALAKTVRVRRDASVVFLAEHLLNLARRALDPAEQLRLLDALGEACPAGELDVAWCTLQRRRARAALLRAVGRDAEALELTAASAREFPHDLQARLDHVQALQSAARYEEAAAEAEDALAREWLDSEAEPLFAAWTDALWRRRDLARLAAVTEKWVARTTASEDAHVRRLSVLLYQGQHAEVDRWVEEVFASEIQPRDPAYRARFGAALQIALGNGWQFWSHALDERWQAPLAEVALELAAQPGDAWMLAQRVIWDWRFRQTDGFAKLRKGLRADFEADVATLPADAVARYVSWIGFARNEIDAAQFRRLADALRARLRATEDETARDQLGDALLAMLDAHEERAEAADVLRERIAGASEPRRTGLRQNLIERLAAMEWSAEREAELFALLRALEPTAAEAPAYFAGAVRRLADRLSGARLEAELGPAAEREKLPRAELRERVTKARAAVRAALAQSFAAAAGAASPSLRPWLEIEGLCFAAEAGTDPAEVESSARVLLAVPLDLGAEPLAALRARCATVLAYAATRRAAPADLADRVLALYRERVGSAGDSGPSGSGAVDWRYQIFRLLVVLDRTAELERELRGWIDPNRFDRELRVALGYLLAESGRIAEAVPLFEEVARAHELLPQEFAALADWYLVLGDDAARDRARSGRYEAMAPGQLDQIVMAALQRWRGGGDRAPEPVDADTLLALQVLLRKASEPARYVWWVHQMYEGTKDVRLLECLVDGTLGHSPEGVYAYLSQAAELVRAVFEEATCDQLAARADRLAEAAATATDRRALALLRAQIEQRAGQVLDQPGPHRERSFAALRAAFDGALAPDEGRHLARYLASLGKLDDRDFSDEQRRQLEELHRRARAGSAERLEIALHLWRTRWAYGEQEAAIDGLGAALHERGEALHGALDAGANEAVSAFVGWLGERRSYAVAERFLRAQIAAQSVEPQQHWYRDRLEQIWVECVQNQGTVSLGRGPALYAAVRELLVRELFDGPGDRIQGVIERFCQLHHVAHAQAGIATARADLARFSREVLPELLSRMAIGQAQVVSAVAEMLRVLGDPRAGLAALIARAESESVWLRRLRIDVWSQNSWQMAHLRQQIGELGDLDGRLLAIVLRELEHALRTQSEQNHAFWHRRNSYFWAEKAQEFAAVARAVLADSAALPVRARHVANYLWDGLDLRAEAAAALLAAAEREAIDEDGRALLVTWLHELRRFGESLPHARVLAESWPDHLGYRVLLMIALHETDHDDEVHAIADAVVKSWKERGAWNERAMAELAAGCLRTGLAERAAAVYDEAIAAHQRAGAHDGDAVLSGYCAAASRAYLALGKIAEAVDRASAAVVAWGPQQDQRRQAIVALHDVLAGIADLDGFVAAREAEVARSGLDAPLLRKLIGLVYLERNQPQRARAQLDVARALSPLDAEIHQALLRACDAMGDRDGAILVLRDAIAAAPLQLEAYVELAQRLAGLGQAEEAERAWTTLVEMKPNESDGHARLAEERERQERFAEAAVQWQQVVRIRTSEPPGWLRLARVLIRAGRPDEARSALQHVLDTRWEDRFGDVRAEARRLLGEVMAPPR
jgi:predicted Zn-dependent protease